MFDYSVNCDSFFIIGINFLRLICIKLILFFNSIFHKLLSLLTKRDYL